MALFSKEEMAHAEAVLARVRADWMRLTGVTAVDLGFKWSQGSMTNKLAIRIHVTKKRPLAELTTEERFPQEIEGVPIDVIEATYGLQSGPEPAADSVANAALISSLQQPYDPVPLGVSVGNPRITAGTLGAKVFDAPSGKAMILSNWHVFAGSPNARPGEAILQPGPQDGGQADDEIANLRRFILGPFDAAVAQLNGRREVQSATLDGEAIEDVITPALGMSVWKVGRTTGRTTGYIDGVQMSTLLYYGPAGSKMMTQVMRIVPLPDMGNVEISMGGDSGAVWVDAESGKAVGLHFAGEIGDAPEHALATELQPVLTALNVLLPAQLPEPVDEAPLPEEPIPTPVTPAPPEPVLPAPDPRVDPAPNPPVLPPKPPPTPTNPRPKKSLLAQIIELILSWFR
jgi:endonuclease G